MSVTCWIERDAQVDAIYIHFNGLPIAYSREFSDDIVGDYTDDGVLVGIDIQRVSQMQLPEYPPASINMAASMEVQQATFAG